MATQKVTKKETNTVTSLSELGDAFLSEMDAFLSDFPDLESPITVTTQPTKIDNVKTTTAPSSQDPSIEQVKIISDEELFIIKNDVIFRLTDSTSGDKYTFSKVCNVSRFDANAIFVILYLNEKGKDRNAETQSFVDCSKEEFFTPAKVFVSLDLLNNYTSVITYQKRGEHFGKISLKLIAK